MFPRIYLPDEAHLFYGYKEDNITSAKCMAFETQRYYDKSGWYSYISRYSFGGLYSLQNWEA